MAIAKCFSLIEAGVTRSKLCRIDVQAMIGLPANRMFVAHMVLGYRTNPVVKPRVLDNLMGEIRSAQHCSDLKPAFNSNGDDVWARAPGGQQRPVPA